MLRTVLRDDQWSRIEQILPGRKNTRGVTAQNNRLFIEAVLWILRTGAPWRDMPVEFGHWHRIYVRYNRWSHKGYWESIFESLCVDGDFEYCMIDGSIVRVHQDGAPKKNRTRNRSSWQIKRWTQYQNSCGM